MSASTTSGSSRRREAADELLQHVLVVTVALGVDPGFGEAVGVEQQGVSGLQMRGSASCEVSIGDDAPTSMAAGQVGRSRPTRRRAGADAGGMAAAVANVDVAAVLVGAGAAPERARCRTVASVRGLPCGPTRG